MIAVTRSKYGLPVSDIFFADNISVRAARSPLCLFQQTATPHRSFKPVHTSAIDLTAPVEELSAPISKNTRYKITRAEREGFTPHVVTDPTAPDAALFADYYDTFARHKGLPPCNRARLTALRECSALLLSSVTDTDGQVASAHAYVKDSSAGRVRLLYSASHFRAMTDSAERNRVGRANRLLHWHEILTLKELGFGVYDLGGLPVDSSDEEKNAIARFKLEFGGKLLVEYNGVVPTNLVGRLLLPLVRRRL